MKTLLTSAGPVILFWISLSVSALLIISSFIVRKKMPSSKNINASLAVLSVIPLLFAGMFNGKYESSAFAAAGFHPSVSLELFSVLFCVLTSGLVALLACWVLMDKRLTS